MVQREIGPGRADGQGGAVYDVDPEESIGTFQEAWEAAKKRTADEENRTPAVACRWHDLRHNAGRGITGIPSAPASSNTDRDSDPRRFHGLVGSHDSSHGEAVRDTFRARY